MDNIWAVWNILEAYMHGLAHRPINVSMPHAVDLEIQLPLSRVRNIPILPESLPDQTPLHDNDSHHSPTDT